MGQVRGAATWLVVEQGVDVDAGAHVLEGTGGHAEGAQGRTGQGWPALGYPARAASARPHPQCRSPTLTPTHTLSTCTLVQDPLVPEKYPPEMRYLAAQQTPNTDTLTNWSATHEATPKWVQARRHVACGAQGVRLWAGAHTLL